MASKIPMCWKCKNLIRQPGLVFTIIGCKECPEIHTYEDAKEECPYFSKNRKQNEK